MKADQKARNRYLGGTVPFGWTLDDESELVACEPQFDLSHAGVKKIIESAQSRATA
ncbi:MAG: hypothetical protein K2Q10_00570 [Rhodospirillales bacterium]|nr:hypothetical protein [Rhodospirillales bacterium]